jgi:aminodeoxychorismate lyase
MTCFVNGRFVSAEDAVISPLDRGFLYGDGLFETLRVYEGIPFLWPEHWQRLVQGLAFLKITNRWSSQELFGVIVELLTRNVMKEGLCRITVSRGCGSRGYSPKGANEPTLVITLHPLAGRPEGLRLHTSTFQLPSQDALSLYKTSNKLRQVLARAEADEAGADEALLCNSTGQLVEASSANLFWVRKEQVYTAPVLKEILPGVTRAHVLRLCARLGIPVVECAAFPHELFEADGVFLTSSALEISPAISLDGRVLRRSPLCERLQSIYRFQNIA